jgi:hypothetical protein
MPCGKPQESTLQAAMREGFFPERLGCGCRRFLASNAEGSIMQLAILKQAMELFGSDDEEVVISITIPLKTLKEMVETLEKDSSDHMLLYALADNVTRNDEHGAMQINAIVS